jgi:Co/Zn/Cd efflux system component
MPNHIHSPEHDRWHRSLIALLLTFGLLAVQYYVWTTQESVTLLGDFVHTNSDALTILGATWVAWRAANAKPVQHRVEYALTFFAIATLLFGALVVFWEAYDHWKHPVGYSGWALLLPALYGMIGNFISHRLLGGVDKELHTHLHHSVLEHFFQDFIISAAVLMTGIVNIVVHAAWIDAPLGFCVGLFLLYRSWKLLTTPFDHQH